MEKKKLKLPMTRKTTARADRLPPNGVAFERTKPLVPPNPVTGKFSLMASWQVPFLRSLRITLLSFQKAESSEVFIHTIKSSSSTCCQQLKALLVTSLVPVKLFSSEYGKLEDSAPVKKTLSSFRTQILQSAQGRTTNRHRHLEMEKAIRIDSSFS